MTKRDDLYQQEHIAHMERWQSLPVDQQGPQPESPPPTTFEDIKEMHSALLKEFSVASTLWTTQSTRYQNVWTWVNATVDRSILSSAMTELVGNNKTSLQELVRALKRQFAPTDTSALTTAREEYRAILKQAELGSVNPARWYQDWHRAFLRARALRLADVEGTMATKDFLIAISLRIAPEWARGRSE